uniref:Putative ovule protein n=1 Tax=Solanum chacoense TaxID=4108 RepID=A0A0V0HQD2_SOLCH
MKENNKSREEPPSEEVSHMQQCDTTQTTENKLQNLNQTEKDGTDIQVQQIFEAEPVAIQNSADLETVETEASSWVNSHILDSSNTYGVAFEGFKSKTLSLLVRIDERKVALDNKEMRKANVTP